MLTTELTAKREKNETPVSESTFQQVRKSHQKNIVLFEMNTPDQNDIKNNH